jgi:hypothetical protein
MASIYANASLTIIAAEGDHANHGIRGIRNVSEPRVLDQHVFTLPSRIQVCEVPFSDLSQTKWFERGWTFQEYLFSSRRLIFGDSRVRWECGQSKFQEDVDFLLNSQANLRPTRTKVLGSLENFMEQSWPNLSSYSNTVRFYNSRHVTYARDANLAFAGLCSVLHAKYEGGFLHGLPEMFFDVALLWQPASVLERRVSPTATSSPPDSMLPSWSWMGWRGEIDSWSWESGTDFVMGCMTSVRTIGILDWYTGSSGIHPNKWRKIAITSQRYSHLFNSGDDPLPLGWSRRAFDFMSLSPYLRDRCPEKQSVTTIFKHESDTESEFWWPIPIPQNTSDEKAIQPQTDLLFCRTTRAWFYSARDVRSYRPGASLRDKEGKWVGYINFHDNETLQDMPEFRTSPFIGCVLELVAVSQGYARNHGEAPGVDEFEMEERPKGSELYEFYNVMWIEWKDAVAYRKGLGRILKSVWESESQKGVDVILG